MNDKLKKVQDDDLSIIELDNRCDMSVIDPALGLVLFDTSGTTINNDCPVTNTNCVTGC